MRKNWLVVLLMVCIVLSCIPLYAQDIAVLDGKIKELKNVTGAFLTEWRYIAGDVKDGQDPSLDISTWKSTKEDAFMCGGDKDKIAWVRTKIVVPAEIGGISLKGSKLSLRCGVDDDGVVYVNGKETGKFNWDDGNYRLSNSVEPGQVFDLAIKINNTGGPVGVHFAKVEYSYASEYVQKINSFLDRYNYGRSMYNFADKDAKKECYSILSNSLALVNSEAMKQGNYNEFLTSLNTASTELGKVSTIAKAYTVNLVGHAHIDMNWLWLWPETIDVCKNTFSTMFKLMDEYPGFTFSQSQPATYFTMQKEYPEIFAKIKEMVKRGQWDASTASNWTEADNNMSSGESIVRSLMYGKRYMEKEFGVVSDVCWQPDTFGHPWSMPQILAKSGMKYYFFTRCGVGLPIFWWKGLDGSKILAYNNSPYSSGIEDSIALDAMRLNKDLPGVKDYMRVYGVGDHGGGPTKEMLNVAKELQADPSYPTVKYSKATDYYQTILKQKTDYPVWNNELNSIFEGCYTTHTDAKKWNRESEYLLPCAEKFASIASNWGYQYPTKDFESSWRNTAFNQFHDILCGSAIHGSYDYSKELFEQATGQAKTSLDKSLGLLAQNIKTKGAGIPIVVYNSLTWTRTDAVEVTNPFAGEKTSAKIVDASGKEYPAQNKGDKLYFTAEGVPALGYKVFWAKRSAKPLASAVKVNGTTIENQFYKISVDPKLGVLTQIYDKVNARDILPKDSKAALLQILLEKPHGMSAWFIGEIAETKDILDESEVVTMDSGPAKATLSFDHAYDKSQFVQELTVYNNIPRIDIRMTADWQQKGGGNVLSPMLKVAFPTNLKNAKATYEIPFGSIERKQSGAEMVSQKWIDLSEPGYGISLLNNCKYGFDVKDETVRATLIRAAYDPDPAPDMRTQEATYSIYAHKGDWRAANTVRRGYELNEPLIAKVVDSHSGNLPTSKSFVSVSAPNVVVTAFKQAEDDSSYILRFYESQGKPGNTTITVNLPAKYAVETNLLESPSGKKISISNGKFTVKVGKYEIKTYKLTRG